MVVAVNGQDTPTGSVRSVERAMNLIFCLAAYPQGASLQQLAQGIECSKSTVHRLLGTLDRLAVTEQEPASRLYRLGPRVRELARFDGSLADTRQTALPFMRELRDASEETVTLQQVQDGWHVVVEQCESEHEVRRVLAIGKRLPIRGDATSRAILSALPAGEVDRLLKASRAHDERAPTADELAAVRQTGYAFAFSIRVPGGASISAPIFDVRDRVWGALSVSGPSFRFTRERAAECSAALLQAARRVSLALGAGSTTPVEPAPAANTAIPTRVHSLIRVAQEDGQAAGAASRPSREVGALRSHLKGVS